MVGWENRLRVQGFREARWARLRMTREGVCVDTPMRLETNVFIALSRI